jgi:hypothetical protein
MRKKGGCDNFSEEKEERRCCGEEFVQDVWPNIF